MSATMFEHGQKTSKQTGATVLTRFVAEVAVKNGRDRQMCAVYVCGSARARRSNLRVGRFNRLDASDRNAR